MMEKDKCKYITKEKSTITLIYGNYQTMQHDEYGHRFLQPLICNLLQPKRIKANVDSNTMQTSHDGGENNE